MLDRLHDGADLVADELCGRVVGLFVRDRVVEREQNGHEAALVPTRLVLGVAPLFADLERRVCRQLGHHTEARHAVPLALLGASGRLPAGMLKFGVRWNTVSCCACSAISGIDWMADEPVPMTPTRRPVKSTPSCGQWPVW